MECVVCTSLIELNFCHLHVFQSHLYPQTAKIWYLINCFAPLHPAVLKHLLTPIISQHTLNMCIPLLAGYTFQTHHVLKLKASLFLQLPKLLLSLILLSLKGTLIYTYYGILIACKPVFSTNSKILEDKECYLIRVSTPSLTQYLLTLSLLISKLTTGTSMVVQSVRPHTSNAGATYLSLVMELISHMLGGVVKNKTNTNNKTAKTDYLAECNDDSLTLRSVPCKRQKLV